MFGVECIDVEFAADVGSGIGAHDVESEAAEAGEDCGLDSDAAVVFVERDVANVIIPILDSPVQADRAAQDGGR